MAEHRNLAAFARWFLSRPLRDLRPPDGALLSLVTSGGRVTGIVLFREPPWQVELFLNPPGGGGFPAHRHPNVDSIEFFLAGQIGFELNGERLPERLVDGTAPDGASALCGTVRRVRPSDWHGATVGPKGGAFLSMQRWLNGVRPTSVVHDWEGPPHIEARHE